MNWMNGLCLLIGLGLGLEIMWCVMKYRNRDAKDQRYKYLCPCEVDGDKAYFHGWAEGRISKFGAVIEYLDGTISLVPPERIRFTEF